MSGKLKGMGGGLYVYCAQKVFFYEIHLLFNIRTLSALTSRLLVYSIE